MTSQQHTVLEVRGMTCPSCVRHITAALDDLAGVHRVVVDLRDGVVVVTHDVIQTPTAQLVEAIRQAGYTSNERSATVPGT